MTYDPPFRSPAVTRHARGQHCTLRLMGICNHNPETTISAHIRDRFKGMGTKASDHSIVFACSECHRYLDETHLAPSLITDIELLEAIIRGLQETWAILIRDGVIGFPHDVKKPRTVKARKPPEQRAPITGRSTFPAQSRPMQSRNDLRRRPKETHDRQPGETT